jgi:hypothetical protein
LETTPFRKWIRRHHRPSQTHYLVKDSIGGRQPPGSILLAAAVARANPGGPTKDSFQGSTTLNTPDAKFPSRVYNPNLNAHPSKSARLSISYVKPSVR